MVTPAWIKRRRTMKARFMKHPPRWVMGGVNPGDIDFSARGQMTQIVSDPSWTLIN